MENIRLNDYIGKLIETNGIEYVVNHYLELRETYYQQKQGGTN